MRLIGRFRWLQCWAQLNTNRIICLICQLINSPLIAPTDSWQINWGTNFFPLNAFLLISVLTSHASWRHRSSSLYPRTKPDALPSSHLIWATSQLAPLLPAPSLPPISSSACAEASRWCSGGGHMGRSALTELFVSPSEARKMEEDM
jgi:hypothetical protein